MAELRLPEHLKAIPGTALTPGRIAISAAEATSFCELLGTPAVGDALHPIYVYVATQRGLGMSVAEVCALADFDIADGPMLGNIDFQYSAPMLPDTEYRVEGTIIDIVRKEGRSAGVFDLLQFEERLVADDGTVVASSRSSFVLPRKENR